MSFSLEAFSAVELMVTDHLQPGDKCVCECTHVLHRHIDSQEGKEENFDAI